MPRRVTDPFVGTGVNSISTGTPFVAPAVFQPYDAEGLLGVPRTVELSHLASTRVVEEVARALGVELSREAAVALRDRVKAAAYASGTARVDPVDAMPSPAMDPGTPGAADPGRRSQPRFRSPPRVLERSSGIHGGRRRDPTRGPMSHGRGRQAREHHDKTARAAARDPREDGVIVAPCPVGHAAAAARTQESPAFELKGRSLPSPLDRRVSTP